MIIVAPVLLSCLAGAVLGTRYRVFVLVPVTLAAWTVALLVGTTTSVSGTVWSLVLIALAMQFGYVFGFAVRTTMVAARAKRALPELAVAAQSSRRPSRAP